jgi:competence protein ComEC
VEIAPLPIAAVPLVVATAFALGGRRRPRPATIRAAVVLLAFAAISARPTDRLAVLDVGQGDAILWEGPHGSGMVDAGPPGWNGRPSAGAAAVHLRGVRIRTIVSTHAHADHYGGFLDLPQVPEAIFVAKRTDAWPDAFGSWLESSERAGARVIRPSREWTSRGRLSVRSPWIDVPPEGSGENDHSLSSRWVVRRTVVWLLGDQEPAAEAAFLESLDSVKPGGILVAPHHGSRGSTSKRLLDALRPRLVLISCGTGNPHGHPHAELLERVRASGAAHLRTDEDGTVTITPTRNGFRVRWQRDFPGPRRLLPAIPLCEPTGFS